MIKITVDEQVLTALSKALAGKTSKARALLNDYVALLEQEIWDAMQRPTGVVQADLPPASHTKVMAVSPQILENCGYEDHTIYR